MGSLHGGVGAERNDSICDVCRRLQSHVDAADHVFSSQTLLSESVVHRGQMASTPRGLGKCAEKRGADMGNDLFFTADVQGGGRAEDFL